MLNRKTVGLYHTGALGDLLVSLPALFDLISLFPGSPICIVGSGLWRQILLPEMWPQVSSLLETDKSFRTLKLWVRDPDNPQAWALSSAQPASLKAVLNTFHTSVDLRSESARFAARSAWARVPRRVGAGRSVFVRPLFTDFYRETPDFYHAEHESLRYLRILSPLYGASALEDRVAHWKQEGLPFLKKIKHTSADHPSTTSSYILINPTASIREKAWPASRFGELAKRLIGQEGLVVKIIGAPSETAWLQEVASYDPTLEIIQPQSISQLIDIVSAARLLITNTSSMQFIACAQRTLVCTLVGAASPVRWGPVGEHAHFIRVEPATKYLRPAESSPKDAKSREVQYYSAIDVETVFQKVGELLQHGHVY